MPTCEETCFDNYLAEVTAAWTQYHLDYAACNGDPGCIDTAKAKRDALIKQAGLKADLCIENCKTGGQ
jgi:hypothetical protein